MRALNAFAPATGFLVISLAHSKVSVSGDKVSKKVLRLTSQPAIN